MFEKAEVPEVASVYRMHPKQAATPFTKEARKTKLLMSFF